LLPNGRQIMSHFCCVPQAWYPTSDIFGEGCCRLLAGKEAAISAALLAVTGDGRRGRSFKHNCWQIPRYLLFRLTASCVALFSTALRGQGFLNSTPPPQTQELDRKLWRPILAAARASRRSPLRDDETRDPAANTHPSRVPVHSRLWRTAGRFPPIKGLCSSS